MFSEPLLPSPFPTTEELTVSQRKVEIRGGINVPGPHTGGGVTIVPNDEGKKKGVKPQRVQLTGCGHVAAVEIPVDEDDRDPEYVSACLICDGLFMSPKYGYHDGERSE